MSSATAASDEAPDAEPAQEYQPTDAFDWERLTLSVEGEVVHTEVGPTDNTTIASHRTLSLERPLRGPKDFKKLVLQEIEPKKFDPVKKYVLDEYSALSFPSPEADEPWTITVEGPVGAWEHLAAVADAGNLAPPLANPSGITLLKSAMNYDVAGPNCTLALLAVRRHHGRSKSEWFQYPIEQYATQIDIVDEDADLF